MAKYPQMEDVNQILRTRLKKLRLDKGITQNELADVLSDVSCRQEVISVPAVSAWETGRKRPALYVLITIADYYGVSLDYLLGRTEDDKRSVFVIPQEKEKLTNTQISYDELQFFDGKPVYMIFHNKEHINQWGIVDIKNKKINLKNISLDISSVAGNNYSFYVYTPDFEQKIKFNQRAHACDYETMYESERIYVVMCASDEIIHLKYDGWYRHNEDHSMLINNIGLALPYEGFGATYYCYKNALSPMF